MKRRSSPWLRAGISNEPTLVAGIVRLAVLMIAAHVVMLQGVAAADPGPRAGLRLLSVEPTVLFVAGKEDLRQVVEVTVENPGEVVEGRLEVRLGQVQTSADLGKLTKGRSQAASQRCVREAVLSWRKEPLERNSPVELGLGEANLLHPDVLPSPGQPDRRAGERSQAGRNVQECFALQSGCPLVLA